MASIAPIAAGALALTAYADAKWHLRKDIAAMRRSGSLEKTAQQSIETGRVGPWYAFEDHVNNLPANTQCLWSRQGCYTWQDTHRQSSKFANFLLANGIKSGDMVGVYLMNSPQFVFTCLGMWALGCGAGWINYHLAGDGLVHCLKVSTAKVIVVDADEGCRQRIEDVRERIEGELGMKIIVLDEETKRAVDEMPDTPPDEKHRKKIDPASPMLLMYTSGSTGFPKACPMPIGRSALLGSRAKQLGLKPGPDGDRWYNCMPMYHGTGGTTMICCLLTGVTQCIGTRFSLSRFWDDIRDSQATGFVYVGETARYLLSQPPGPRDRDHKAWFMYGNGMRPDVWSKFVDRFGIKTVGEFFTSSEGVFSLYNQCSGPFLQNAVGHHGGISRWRLKDVYVPVMVDHDTETIWRDPQTGFAKRMPFEEGGEILVKLGSKAEFTGYFGNEEATNKKFERDVFQKGDLYYRTGDALRRTADGAWFFLDRLGDSYRWKSENVSTSEVSEILGRSPGIHEAIVYGVPVPGHDGKAGCAAIKIDPSIPESSYPRFFADLMAHAQKTMPRYAVPVFLRVLRGSNSMHNNKQDKGPLKKAGYDLDAIYGHGKDVEQAREEGRDIVMWWPAALGLGSKGEKDTWMTFSRRDWELVKAAGGGQAARL